MDNIFFFNFLGHWLKGWDGKRVRGWVYVCFCLPSPIPFSYLGERVSLVWHRDFSSPRPTSNVSPLWKPLNSKPSCLCGWCRVATGFSTLLGTFHLKFTLRSRQLSLANGPHLATLAQVCLMVKTSIVLTPLVEPWDLTHLPSHVIILDL